MIEDLIRQQDILQRQVDNLIMPEMGYDFISPFLGLPGLVGFWPMSSVQRSTGNVYDLSGQARTLTYNGNPTFNIYNNVVPYIDLDGTGDYLSRADETDLDVLGTESWAAVPGLTFGGWFASADAVDFRSLVGKLTNAANGSFRLLANASNIVSLQIINSAAITSVASTVAYTIDQWYFAVGRFVPSTSIDIYFNSTKTSNTTSIPASIDNSTAPFEIGRAYGNLFNGNASTVFLCANALPDALIYSLFQQTRGLFGV